MSKIQKIWEHPLYQEHYLRIQELEKERRLCCHTLEHFLAVARLTYIYVLEEGLEVSRRIIYAAGLLHDIGKDLQYTQGIPHEEASARIAEKILRDCGFAADESEMILDLILTHRKKKKAQKARLNELFYKAGKGSRNCLICPAIAECNWSIEKKNMRIRY